MIYTRIGRKRINDSRGHMLRCLNRNQNKILFSDRRESPVYKIGVVDKRFNWNKGIISIDVAEWVESFRSMTGVII